MDIKPTRREAILDAAIKRFARVGYRKTTLAEVAKDVGMVKSALYKYFTDKEDLFRAAVDRLAKEVMHEVEQRAKKGRTAAGRIKLLLLGVYDLYQELAVSVGVTLEGWHDLRPFFLRIGASYHRSFSGVLASLIVEGIKDGELASRDPHTVAAVANIALDRINEGVLLGELSLQEGRRHVSVMLDVMMDGLTRRGVRS
ncbi:MAG: TetR/AcrR family transcriptional regulator [Myxococcales bacterium]|nr:MAG: TetR/AcrR family transcriptional regulator [Myxococcales bacterium]